MVLILTYLPNARWVQPRLACGGSDKVDPPQRPDLRIKQFRHSIRRQHRHGIPTEIHKHIPLVLEAWIERQQVHGMMRRIVHVPLAPVGTELAFHQHFGAAFAVLNFGRQRRLLERRHGKFGIDMDQDNVSRISYGTKQVHGIVNGPLVVRFDEVGYPRPLAAELAVGRSLVAIAGVVRWKFRCFVQCVSNVVIVWDRMSWRYAKEGE